jgi:hypothetical protein
MTHFHFFELGILSKTGIEYRATIHLAPTPASARLSAGPVFYQAGKLN